MNAKVCSGEPKKIIFFYLPSSFVMEEFYKIPAHLSLLPASALPGCDKILKVTGGKLWTRITNKTQQNTGIIRFDN